jgi:HPt (histidine-containing phosphotransfer) domain-containing protein
MSNQTSLNTFIFNNEIDAAYLYEMYENDYPYIQTIFKAILDTYEEDLAAIHDNYRKKDLELLRRSAHKIKPTFGFAGMLATQEKCREFEHKCQAAMSIGEIEMDFSEWIKHLEEAGIIIMEEHKKLKSFNNSGS